MAKTFYQIREKHGDTSVCVQTAHSKITANRLLKARLAAGRDVFIVEVK